MLGFCAHYTAFLSWIFARTFPTVWMPLFSFILLPIQWYPAREASRKPFRQLTLSWILLCEPVIFHSNPSWHLALFVTIICACVFPPRLDHELKSQHIGHGNTCRTKLHLTRVLWYTRFLILVKGIQGILRQKLLMLPIENFISLSGRSDMKNQTIYLHWRLLEGRPRVIGYEGWGESL